MPGHKLGRGIPDELSGDLALWDLTEIPGTDNLHFPTGAIKEAQDLAARAFGADNTFFLVNGSTCGIHAVVMTICKPGDRLIVARNCHKSVITAMMLAGVEPVYIKPEYDRSFGISTIVSPAEVERAIKQYPDVSGVIITSPNYYGICSDIREIARITHSYGKILTVDEAHGSHLCFGTGLPECAMRGGADICVQSAHKTLPAFTQGAYLHTRGNRIDIDKLRDTLSMLQTSSPSYIIMSSLDIAREIMQRDGAALLEKLMKNIIWMEEKLDGLEGLSVLNEKLINKARLDKTRVVINIKNLGITGFNIEKILRKEYNIQVEMSDFYNIVCIGTVADRRQDYEKLCSSMSEIAFRFKGRSPLSDTYTEEVSIPEQKVLLREIIHAKSNPVKFTEAAGCISSSMIVPYPPGIPVVCPGEVISDQVVEYINRIIHSGGTVNGINESGEIRIIKYES